MIRNIILLTFVMCYSPLCFAQTPHNLLWDGTPEDGKKALKIMMDDPTWVTKRDSDQRTPLHVAARFNHTSVVKWLLENGADVDAQAYNRFTPLHQTKNPEIVKLILEKKPNLALKSVSGTVLQKAIYELRLNSAARLKNNSAALQASGLVVTPRGKDGLPRLRFNPRPSEFIRGSFLFL